ncbi:hypothetical protein [Cognatiyoonia sp. IB215182]|uniref:hypothetical protein n=1 Tax=Cognatiyoonia sp. IB215182 TaxID=3097353 RepID=UPI002A0D4B94|nr:hypothetical protein [Cognatiyoonia sp. IB215182]MDX8354358.1 hypothetical protein [Cognatiyoonia sp. IB215182]
MFKVVEEPEFTHDVPIQVPDDDGHSEQILRTRFRAISLSDGEAYDLSTKEGTTAYLQRIIVSFENLVDLEDRKIAYTDAVRDQLLDRPYIRMGLTTAYMRAMHKARAGN